MRLLVKNKNTVLFNINLFLKSVFQLFAIIVFGCISSKGYNLDVNEGEEPYCLYNGDTNACNYGVTIGVLAFLGLLVFLFLDAIFETRISSIQHRKYIVLCDIAFSGKENKQKT